MQFKVGSDNLKSMQPDVFFVLGINTESSQLFKIKNINS